MIQLMYSKVKVLYINSHSTRLLQKLGGFCWQISGLILVICSGGAIDTCSPLFALLQ